MVFQKGLNISIIWDIILHSPYLVWILRIMGLKLFHSWVLKFGTLDSPDILALCETKLDESIDCGNFSVRGYLPLIRKGSSTCMHGLAVYMKEGLPFAWDLSLGNSADSYLSFPLALFHSYFFFLSRSPLSLCMVFYSISSNKEEVLSINPSANVFVFGVFNVIIRTNLPILVELIDLVNSAIIFLSQTTLLRWLTFLLRSQTVILIVLLFWIYFFLLMLVFVLQCLSFYWEILIILSRFPLTFHRIHNVMSCFIT